MYVLDPLHDYAVVQALPAVMQRIAASNPDATLPAWVPRDGKQLIALPDSMASEGMPADSGTGKTGGRGGAVTTLLVGRVLWVGKGKHREGQFITPTIKRGEMVLFMPRTVSYEFSLHGRSIKIVPYHELVSSVREVGADSAEWREFLALVERAANDAASSEAQLPAAEAV
jgi:hypothetical protein